MQRNTSRNRNIFVSIGVYILLVLSFSGTLMGTYAWFSYNARAASLFRGTAVSKHGDLRVGIYSETELVDFLDYNLVRDENNPNVYWGSNEGLQPEQISYYLNQNGYASNSMNPVTSGPREAEGALNLHSYPTALDNSFIYSTATRNNFVYIPLVFSATGETTKSKLYINDANVRSNGEIKNSVRIYSKSDLTNFVFAPNIARSSYDEVGGVLNLDEKDNYYDYQGEKEFAYGEFEKLVYKSEKTTVEREVEEPSTFNAIHKEGVYAIDFDESITKKSYFYGYESIFNKEKAIAEVDGGYNKVEFTIYLEGWNKSLDNSELYHYFNLDLTFEVGA